MDRAIAHYLKDRPEELTAAERRIIAHVACVVSRA
jgi:hypothetical protein